MAEVLGDLAALGFDAEWDCIPAAIVGAPHLRYRIFVVAYAGSDQLWDESRRGSWSSGKAEALAGDDGETESLADAERLRRVSRGHDSRQSPRTEPLDSRPQTLVEPESVGRGDGSRVFSGLGSARRGRWSAEPDVGRVAHGVPSRVDRLRALGNAVVPQVAEAVGRLIAEHSLR
jgi:DNA (cytosine-5)-methyltransferase 1